MEKKKLLLVSVSVGLFLVIVIGASILVFSPRDYPSVTKSEIVPVSPGTPHSSAGVLPVPVIAAAPTGPSDETAVPSVDTLASGANTPAASIDTPQANEQRTLENVIYINGENAETAVRVERLNDGNTRTIITIPSPHENIITLAPPPPEQNKAVVAQTEVAAAAPPKVAPVKQEAPAARQEPAAAPPPSSGAKTEKAASTPAWWVQTSSHSKKAYADNAKKFLEGKGITSVIMNGVVNGKTFYRVRVGPYSSQAEADYWLSLIKTIEGMENSLVWKSSNL